MKLTRDEARLLAEALSEVKYDMLDVSGVFFGEEISKKAFKNIEALEKKLFEAGVDKRRSGRSSQNTYADLIKRFAFKNYEDKK